MTTRGGGRCCRARRPDATYIKLSTLGHYPQWEDPPTIAAAIRRPCDSDQASG